MSVQFLASTACVSSQFVDGGCANVSNGRPLRRFRVTRRFNRELLP
ncbi:MAG: hypothetical protein AAGA75_15345 [Cyanobacteria bacterium P01_E01_bin.6]